MKKALLLLLLVFAFMYYSSAQNNWHWYNPFGFDPNLYGNAMLSHDTSGKLFLFGPKNYDKMYVIDQSGTVRDSSNNFLQAFDSHNFLIDSRNEAWFVSGHHAGPSSFSGAFRSVNGIWTEIDNSAYSWGYIYQVVDDHHKNDYFVAKAYGFPSQVDTFVVVKFDGSVQKKIDITHIMKPYPHALDYIVLPPSLICDYNGALYLISDTTGLAKYENESWSFYPINDSLSPPLLLDYQNNVYFNIASTKDLIVRFDGNKFDSIHLPACVINNSCKPLEYKLGPDSSVVLLVDSAAFYKLNPNKTWTYIPAPGFKSYRSFSTYTTTPTSTYSAFDKKGRLWVVSDYSPIPFEFSKPVGVYSAEGFDSITGKVYWDANENQVQDNGESGFKNVVVAQLPNDFVSNTASDGTYACITLRDSTDYTISVPYPPKYFHFTTPSKFILNPSIRSYCCYNFGLAANLSIRDLEIEVTSGRARPGFENVHWISYNNAGTISISDTIQYIIDSAYTYLSSDPLPAYTIGQVIKWAFHNLNPFELRNISVVLKLDSLTALGDTLHSIANDVGIALDTTPLNNVYHLKEIVVGSFDPNEKKVNPESGIPSDELAYTIFFQNTGTDTAFKVIIRDTLSKNLDIASFRVIGYSHPLEYTLKDAGIIEFRFNNILLPDSHINEPLSHGFVKYTIKAKSNLPLSAQINNTAYIYFDFNAPVVTNTTTNTFNPAVGISPHSFGEEVWVRIFPNPATTELFIQTTNFQPQTLSIFDMSGRKMMEEKYSPQIDISALHTGVYFMELKNEETVVRKRWVKVN